MEAIMITFRFLFLFLPIGHLLFPHLGARLIAQIARHPVISEVYGGGGNAGAVYKNDFIELYNPTSSPVGMSNWSVQYASANGTFTAANRTIFSGTLPANGFFLIKEAQGAGGSLNLPVPDAAGTTALSASNGKVALVADSVLISGPGGGSIVDFVGFGTANQFEGSAAAPAPSNSSSVERKAQGSSTPLSMGYGGPDSLLGNGWDSGDNSRDITVRTHPDPQNSLSAPEFPPASFLVIQNVTRSPFIPDVNGRDTVSAEVEGVVPTLVRLHISVDGGPDDSSIVMTLSAGTVYRGVIPPVKHMAGNQVVEYYISATGAGGEYAATPDSREGYFIGTTVIGRIKSYPLSAITGYGVRMSGTLGVATNLFASGVGYVQDTTAGIQIYQSGGLPVLKAGRNVLLHGTITEYNGGYEISGPGFGFLDTAMGMKTLAPASVELPLSGGAANPLDGMLVKIPGLSSPASGVFMAGRYLFNNPDGDTISILVESNGAMNTLVGTDLPSAGVDAQGILSYGPGYFRLKPRSAEDMGNLAISVVEAVGSGQWSDSLTWSTHRVPAETDHVTVSVPGVTVTIDVPDARCANLVMTGSGSTDGPTLKFDSAGIRTLTVAGSLSISGGSGSGQGGRPKLTSNGNSQAVLIVRHNIFTTSSNATSSGNAGLNMNEGSVRLTGNSVDTLKNGAGLRLGHLQIGDGDGAKVLVWSPSKSSTLVIRSLLVRSNASFLIGSPTDTVANDIGNATMSGVPSLSGGIAVEPGGSLLVQNSRIGTTMGAIHLAGGGIRNDGTILLDSVSFGGLASSSDGPRGGFRSSYTLYIGGFSAAPGETQAISGSSPLKAGSIVVGRADTLSVQQNLMLAGGATMLLNGFLSESPDYTVRGTVIAARVVAKGVQETFGGIGCSVTAWGTAPDTTEILRSTGTASLGETGCSSILRYFEFNPRVNQNLNASIEFSYHPSELAGQDQSKLGIWCSDDGGTHWYNGGLTVEADTLLRVLHVSLLQSLHRITASDAFHPLGNSTVTQLFPVSKGWNMISLPFRSAEKTKNLLFPAAISPAFHYIGEYKVSDTLENSIGYWLKFPADTLCELTGYFRSQDTIQLRDGWNMIGTVSQNISKFSITEDPPGIVVSQYFGYHGGYHVIETLAVGNGYWVKANGGGRLFLSLRAPSHSAMTHGGPSAGPWVSLRFADAERNQGTLHLAPAVGGMAADLPPVPPDELFDVRFTSQRFIESFDKSRDSIRRYPIDVQSRSYPVLLEWICDEDDIGLAVEDSKGTKWTLSGSTGSITLERDRAMHIVLIVTRRCSQDGGYGLTRNYPNPFNPSTSFSLTLPGFADVDIRVYDVSGREISTILSRTLAGGRYTVTWDGSTDRGEPAAGGIYFVRMHAGKYSAVRKVVLVK